MNKVHHVHTKCFKNLVAHTFMPTMPFYMRNNHIYTPHRSPSSQSFFATDIQALRNAGLVSSEDEGDAPDTSNQPPAAPIPKPKAKLKRQREESTPQPTPPTSQRDDLFDELDDEVEDQPGGSAAAERPA